MRDDRHKTFPQGCGFSFLSSSRKEKVIINSARSASRTTLSVVEGEWAVHTHTYIVIDRNSVMSGSLKRREDGDEVQDTQGVKKGP